jgi:hypothetical protein
VFNGLFVSTLCFFFFDLACAQDDDEWYADIDSEEKFKDAALQDPSFEENMKI